MQEHRFERISICRSFSIPLPELCETLSIRSVSDYKYTPNEELGRPGEGRASIQPFQIPRQDGVELIPPVRRLAAQRTFRRKIGQRTEEIAVQCANQDLNRLPQPAMTAEGHERKSSVGLGMSAVGGRADLDFGRLNVCS